jgi:hypothetical protein
LKNGFEIADYLLIELGDVIAGLPLGLNVDWVILNTFSCGHDWLLPCESEKKKRERSDYATDKDSQRERERNVPDWVGGGGWGGREDDGLVKKRLGLPSVFIKGEGALKGGAMTTHCRHVESHDISFRHAIPPTSELQSSHDNVIIPCS